MYGPSRLEKDWTEELKEKYDLKSYIHLYWFLLRDFNENHVHYYKIFKVKLFVYYCIRLYIGFASYNLGG